MPETLDFSANIARFTGFAPVYNGNRPSPPDVLADLLTTIARTPRPELIVDLGCGTGLSTRYWAGKADAVIGIEPTDAMRVEAEALGGEGITYRRAYSHDTGLPDHSARLVTCSQALHWMEPYGTFHEARRILKEGGVFAAYDYDWPPVTGNNEVDAVYQECIDLSHRLEQELAVSTEVRKWEKPGHLGRMKESGCFRHVREILVHHIDLGTPERLVGLLLSQGHINTLLKHGVTENELGVDKLRETAINLLGPEPRRWYWSSRVRVGIV